MCSRTAKTEAVFTKTKFNNERKVYFLPNSAFGIQYTYPK